MSSINPANETNLRHSFAPRPRNIIETGLSSDLISSLICKLIYADSILDLQQLSDKIALSGNIVEVILDELRKKNWIEILAASYSSDGERYKLTDKGLTETLSIIQNKSGYIGPAPVPLEQYIRVVQAQTIQNAKITRDDVHKTFEHITIDPQLLDQLGPAMHSGRAIMIYGLPGTGKTFICKRLANLLGDSVLLPYALSIDENIIQFYDPSLHRLAKIPAAPITTNLQQGADPRYIKCQRPVAISGGELTLEMLEINHDLSARISEAPMQLKANNGMYIIDDLGRQRVSPNDLFNRWIIPLEEKQDYLSLNNGKRVKIPFDVILIFSANINPLTLADDAFLRRLGYKIRFSPINEAQFAAIWTADALALNIDSPASLFELIFARHKQENRPLVPCLPKDLLGLINDQCKYQGVAKVATEERLNIAWETYFINIESKGING